MQALLRDFVPVADEVGRLQRGTDAECRFFQTVAEQGHYAGRLQPSNTRQGIYAIAPSGELLGSLNTRDGGNVAAMLRAARTKYAKMPPAQRRGETPALDPARSPRFERHYPADGLVLHVYTRDLPRPEPVRGWHAGAWNQDYAWFTKAEVAQLVPDAEVGQRCDWPQPLLQRVARCNLIDCVRGQTFPHRAEDVQRARVTATVTAIEGEVLILALEGEVRIERTGRWATRGFGVRDGEQQLGFDAKLLGSARFDRKSQRFVALRLLAAGSRWGATEFNGRDDDPGPAPMGVAFALAAPSERTAPSLHWVYGWQ